MKQATVIYNESVKKWKISIEDAYLFSFLIDLPINSTPHFFPKSGKVFYKLDINKLISDNPGITKSANLAMRRLWNLSEKRLIEIIESSDMNVLIAITEEGKNWGKH